MSIEGQGHFFTIYFPCFVCFVLYLAKISGERVQDHWSSGFIYAKSRFSHNAAQITCNQFSQVDKPIKPCHKQLCLVNRGQMVIIYLSFEDIESQMAHAKFQDHGTSSSEEEDFKGFYHIWAWGPSW